MPSSRPRLESGDAPRKIGDVQPVETSEILSVFREDMTYKDERDWKTNLLLLQRRVKLARPGKANWVGCETHEAKYFCLTIFE